MITAAARLLARGRLPLLACVLGGCGWLCAAAPYVVPRETVQSQAEDTAWRRLDDLERRLRGRAAEAAPALLKLAQELPAGSAEQLEALFVRGALLAQLNDAQGVEAAISQLQGASNVYPVADLLRAHWMMRRAASGAADRLLEDAAAKLPSTTPLGLRMRFATTQGAIAEDLGKLDEAVRHRQEAVDLADRLGSQWQRSEMRSRLGVSLDSAQQFAQSQSVNQEAIAIARAIADPLAISRALSSEGSTLTDMGKVEAGLLARQEAYQYARSANSPYNEVICVTNLADSYLKRGDYPTTLRWARDSVALARQIQDQEFESVGLTNTGLALIAMGKRDEGMAQVRAAVAIEKAAGRLTALEGIQREYAETLEKAGFLKEAWAAYVEHRAVADEVFKLGLQQAVLELQEGFDHQNRQRALAMKATERAMAEASLVNRGLAQRLWAVGALAGLLLLAVVAMLLRRMWRSNAALQNTNAQLKVASERDALTGLANRRHFQAVMRQAAEDGALVGSLMLVDLDHFKRINDQHGHAAGDAVLVEVAHRLRAALREQDLTVRWGGEEFLVVVRALPTEEVEGLAERLLQAIGSEPVRHGRHRIAVTASIGFATFPLRPHLQPLGWERAIDLVDTAMYLAKAHGRNRAYGVRALHADDDATTRPQAATLESAWRAGRADLTQHAGPLPQGPATEQAQP